MLRSTDQMRPDCLRVVIGRKSAVVDLVAVADLLIALGTGQDAGTRAHRIF
jgi:hypothetical protein